MEFKHFSHNHGLVFQQLPQGREIKCSGCKSPGSGSVYVCWQCSYFLHEQCFRATRSLKHPSHRLHPLTLVPYPTYPSGSFYCNTCRLIGSGFSYCCSECEFDLHVHCAMSPNPSSVYQPHPQPQVPYPNPDYSAPPGNNPGFNNPQLGSHMPQPVASTYPPLQNNPNPTYPPQATALDFTPPAGVINNQAAPPPGPNFVPPAPVSNNQAPPPGPNFIPPASVINNQAPPPPGPNFVPPVPVINNQAAPTAPVFPPPGNVTNNQAPPPSAPTAYNVPNPGNQQSTVQQLQQNNPVPVFPPSATVQIPSTSTNPPQANEIKHFSHAHSLKLTEFQKQEGKKCSGCEFAIDGSGFSCVEPQCNFYLDKACFESPMEVRHKSHLDHTLTLLAKPSYEGGQFTCNACLKDGSGFVYNCAKCSYDLHVDCIAWPQSVKREDHKHPLTLFFASPAPKAEGQQEVTFMCDVCQTAVHDMAWTYYCHECDFGTHLECVISQVRPVEKSEEELIRETALKLKVLQLLLNGGGNILL